jgi:hypothetical protein
VNKKLLTIEEAFSLYADNHLCPGISPKTIDAQRHAFFCGFNACFAAFDAMAELSWEDEDDGDEAWQQLRAEFERFAQAIVSGEISIHQ